MFSLSPAQVWFQNRRARTLKCKGAKKALWQSDSPTHDALAAPHSAAGPPPAYPTQVKQEMKEACYYSQCPPAYSSIEELGRYGSMFGLPQGRAAGCGSSPSVRGLWPQGSPVPPVWCRSPLEMRSYGSSRPAITYPTSAESQMYVPRSTCHSSTPDTPDSGFWDASVENTPPLEASYSQLEDSWSGTALESGHVVQHVPLPELSLQEILGVLDEDWLGGGALDGHAAADNMAFC